jgi:hypothetical protein
VPDAEAVRQRPPAETALGQHGQEPVTERGPGLDIPGTAVLAAELGDEPSRSFGQAGTPDPKVLVATRTPAELAQLRAAD